MAWANSKVFEEWIIGPMLQASGTAYTGLDSDTIKAALFDDTITPDNDAAVASTGFNTGVWLATEPPQQFDAAGWATGGLALTAKTFTTPGTDQVRFDAADLPSTANVTITAAVGALIYDDTITAGTVADQGVCYLWFSGPASVTAGSFTIIFGANGLIQFTL
jgi:hypothetical protein